MSGPHERRRERRLERTRGEAPSPRVLLVGVDKLIVSARGSIPRPELEAVMAEQERVARGDSLEGDDERFALGGDVWRVGSTGTKWHKARLTNADLSLRFAPRVVGGNNPELEFELNAAALWRMGWRRSRALCAEISERVFRHPPRQLLLSRVDLCADLSGVAAAFSSATPRQWVKRSRVTTGHGAPEADGWARVSTGEDVNSWRFGTGNLVMRAYDKAREIREVSRDKAWFGDLWKRGGWDEATAKADPPWRVEMQLRREWFKDRPIVDPRTGEGASIDDERGLDLAMAAFWRYAVGGDGEPGWLTHRDEDRHGNHRRWPISAAWKAVQGADWSTCADGFPGVEIDKIARGATWDRLMTGFRGYVTSLQALAGLADADALWSRVAREIADVDERTGTTREAEAVSRAVDLHLVWAREHEGAPMSAERKAELRELVKAEIQRRTAAHADAVRDAADDAD